MAFQNSAVRRDRIAGFENEDISRNDVFTFNHTYLSVTEHFGSRCCHLHERFHCRLRLAFLNQGHHGIDDDHNQDHQDIRKIGKLERPVGFQHGHDRLNPCRDDQHDDHGVSKRTDKLFKQAFFFRFRKLVLPVFSEALFRFRRTQTVFSAVQRSQDLFPLFTIILHVFSSFRLQK